MTKSWNPPKLLKYDRDDREGRILLATVALGLHGFRDQEGRGLVAIRKGETDGRSIESVPWMYSFSEAWKLVNFFAGRGNDDLARAFWALARQSAKKVGGEGDLLPWQMVSQDSHTIANHIVNAAYSAIVYGIEHGWC